MHGPTNPKFDIVSTKSVFLVSIWAVTGQISRTGNMTPTQGISLVLVTGDTSAGLSTLITEVTESQLHCFSTYLVHTSFTCQKTKSAMYGTAYFITTASSLPSDSILSPAWRVRRPLTESLPIPARAGFRILALSQNRCPQFCVMAERVKHVFVCWDE
jgi:hypothetical protein